MTREFMTYSVQVDLSDIIGLDLEAFLDLLMEKVGMGFLEDMSYEVVGVNNGALVIDVTALNVDDKELS